MNVLNFNQVILIGNLVTEPTRQETKNGLVYCRFRLAVNRRHLSSDGKRATDYIDCVAWQERAKFLCAHFQKGAPVMVVGELQSSSYTDRKGNPRYTTEVSVSDIRMIEAPTVPTPPAQAKTLPTAEAAEEEAASFEPPF